LFRGTEAMRVLYDSGNSPLQSVQLTGKDSAYFRADIEGNTISVKVNQTLLSYITKRAYELQLQVSNLTDTSNIVCLSFCRYQIEGIFLN
ncbi:MAG: hypothetical protein QG564_1635, partial [Campylobacterota bacterium]|nr:hypothetical protein [Campylobacterota bacterium]